MRTQKLKNSKAKLQSKGVDSVVKRICNLVEINPHLTVENLDSALVKAYQKHTGTLQQVVKISEDNMDQHLTDRALFQQIFDKYTSPEFLYNGNPNFTHKLEQRFSFGMVELFLSCLNNKISECEVFSDSLDLQFIESIQKVLVSKDYSFEGVEKVREELLRGLGPPYREKIEEFCSCLFSEFFE